MAQSISSKVIEQPKIEKVTESVIMKKEAKTEKAQSNPSEMLKNEGNLDENFWFKDND